MSLVLKVRANIDLASWSFELDVEISHNRALIVIF